METSVRRVQLALNEMRDAVSRKISDRIYYETKLEAKDKEIARLKKKLAKKKGAPVG